MFSPTPFIFIFICLNVIILQPLLSARQVQPCSEYVILNVCFALMAFAVLDKSWNAKNNSKQILVQISSIYDCVYH